MSETLLQIRPVRSKEDADAVYVLAYEFIDWLRVRYPEMEAEIDTYLEHQKFDDQCPLIVFTAYV